MKVNGHQVNTYDAEDFNKTMYYPAGCCSCTCSCSCCSTCASVTEEEE